MLTEPPMTKLLSFPAPLADQSAREAALDIRSSCIIEAPAGSGKTGLLMQRFLKLLAAGGVTEPEQVLAITFTNKATAELRERVLDQLVEAQQQTSLSDGASAFDYETRSLAVDVLARDAELHWGILTRPERLNIRTIDSVCAEIAGSLPLLSQSGGANRPLKDATPLYRLAAQRTLLQLGGSDRRLHSALHMVMLHRDASFLDCETLLSRMLARREQWGELVPLSAELHDDAELDRVVRPRLERALEKIVCDGLTRAASLMSSRMLDQLSTLAAQLAINPGYNGAASPIAFCGELKGPPQIAGDHLEHWKVFVHLLVKASEDDWRGTFNVNHIGFEMSKAEKAALKSIMDGIKSPELLQALADIRKLPPARYPDEQWKVARSLFHVLRHALAELKVLFAERGECDFTELALAARTALGHEFAAPSTTDFTATDLALSAGSRLHHLLVDEMQDTSAAQYDLIQQLTRSWDGSSQTLFLVGDPKQSIYLFRQARVERFIRTMHEKCLGEIQLRPLYLTANFRSQATLVDRFNHTFDLLFPAPQIATATDVPFVAATAVRQATVSNAIAWHPAILSPGDSSLGYEQHQAIAIREIIQHVKARPLPPGRTEPWHIAILARARNHLGPIVAELKRAKIGFRAVDIDPLDQRQEVLDALALTRALLHPADRAAWLAVLHAPWCGLSLADLLALTGEAQEIEACTPISVLVANRRHLLSLDGQSQLDRAWPTLAAALSTLGVSPLSTHIERTWRSLGADTLLNDSQRSNVLRFLSLLREMEPGIDLMLLQSRLKQLFAEPAAGSPGVELLTIHKAKGLEWDVVLVPNLHRTVPRNSSGLLNWLELDQPSATEESAAILLAPIQSKGEDSTQLNKWLNRVKESRERAEEKRLFYVACTRAREELHLFAACKQNANGELTPPASGTLLKACWPAAEEHFLDLQKADAPSIVIPMQHPVADDQSKSLALAAGAEEPAPVQLPPPILQRLPLAFDPLARFNIAAADRLLYPAAASLPRALAFDRPEGSFAVRAFGNVVHRFLQLIIQRLETGLTPDALLAQLPEWQPRLFTILRAEGLAPAIARRDALRALQALQQSLADPEGRWLLSPRTASTTEQALTSSRLQNLRADRTFFAGPTPLVEGNSTYWIVDFKTTTERSLSPQHFEAAELAKYRSQLETYAHIRRGLLPPGTPVRLALYYPLLPRLIHWESFGE
jgi:ATP-dependent exoDNAse (exonuclease V) beta subunit